MSSSDLSAIRRRAGSPGRIAIIGGGVIGLSIGWRLAEAGCRVTIFERDRAGRGASWAAAGMLAAASEAEPGETALLALNRLSQRMWPGFAREVEAASGQTIFYRDEGTLAVALDRDDQARLRSVWQFQTGLGLDLAWLGAAELRAREPHLHPGAGAAIYSPADHQVDNRALAGALAAAFRKAGGVLREQAEVTGLSVSGGRISGVRLGEERHEADTVVLAAGAWSARIPGVKDLLRLPVRPVKGQMLALAMDPAAPLLRHVVWTGRVYLVPRLDGRLIIGATVEERGFDPSLTAGGMLSLLDGAWRALPGIEELPIAESWVGFRPGSRDDAPLLGPSRVEGLVLATGHHRNGILLTPVTADAVARTILTGEIAPEIRPFAPDRFVHVAGRG
jgi:glycine oxidase